MQKTSLTIDLKRIPHEYLRKKNRQREEWLFFPSKDGL
jgi:hypothetical protein